MTDVPAQGSPQQAAARIRDAGPLEAAVLEAALALEAAERSEAAALETWNAACDVAAGARKRLEEASVALRSHRVDATAVARHADRG